MPAALVEPQPAGDRCPACGARFGLPEAEPAICPECGGSVFALDGRAYQALSCPRRVEAAEVPRLLADALVRWGVPERARLAEVHRLSLPYWQRADGRLEAAFATVIDAARSLDAPAAAAEPARLTALPEVPATIATPDAVRLVLLPAFDVLYDVGGRRFHAIIDAHRGAVLADLHPHPYKERVSVAMAAVLALDVVLFTSAAWLAPDNLWRSFLLFALALLLYVYNKAVVRATDRPRP